VLSVSAQNLDKLSIVEGGTASFPLSRNLGANEVYSAQYLFEGETPSAATNDITVSGSLLPSGQSEAIQSSAALTSVKVVLEAVYTAPENSCANRHTYGVGELVGITATPSLQTVTLTVVRGNTSETNLVYDSFGAGLTTSGDGPSVYRCPIVGTVRPDLTVGLGTTAYKPIMHVVEPQSVICRGAGLYDDVNNPFVCLPPGSAGGMLLRTVNYIGPMHVSFQGIAVSEVPCNDVIPATGCFTQGVHNLSHTVSAGAGTAYRIKPGNYWCIDRAESTMPETNWVQGVASEMIWKIPIGWHRLDLLFAERGYWEVDVADNTEYGNTNSPSLLIGGQSDAYRQERHIDADGVFRTDKFGHWISRSRWCRIILDGRTEQWFH
jgi:hypothetical protein